MVRNAQFEPSLFKMNIKKPIEHCLNQVEAAFMLKKPVVICSHRINFVGVIDIMNRNKNLELFYELILRLQKKWPEIEFMNSVQLAELMNNEKGS